MNIWSLPGLRDGDFRKKAEPFLSRHYPVGIQAILPQFEGLMRVATTDFYALFEEDKVSDLEWFNHAALMELPLHQVKANSFWAEEDLRTCLARILRNGLLCTVNWSDRPWIRV